jgi:hypothetical protein
LRTHSGPVRINFSPRGARSGQATLGTSCAALLLGLGMLTAVSHDRRRRGGAACRAKANAEKAGGPLAAYCLAGGRLSNICRDLKNNYIYFVYVWGDSMPLLPLAAHGMRAGVGAGARATPSERRLSLSHRQRISLVSAVTGRRGGGVRCARSSLDTRRCLSFCGGDSRCATARREGGSY